MTLSPHTDLTALVGVLTPQVRQIIAEESNKTGIEGIRARSQQKTQTPSLYALVSQRLHEGTRNTPAQVAVLEAFEKALGTYWASASTLNHGLDVATKQELAKLEHGKDAVPPQEAFFANHYALFIAGRVGLHALGEKPDTEIIDRETFSAQNAASITYKRNVLALAESAAIDFANHIEKLPATDNAAEREKLGDQMLRDALRGTFTTWVNQFRWKTYADIADNDGVTGVSIAVDNTSVKDGVWKESSSAITVDDKIPRATLDDVVGGGELQEKLVRGNTLQLAYNLERFAAVFKAPFVTFTYGPPGCGKSFIAQGSIRTMEQLCAEYGKPFWAFTLATTDFASEFQNASANALMSIIKKINDFKGLVQVYMPDADVMFQARNDPKLSPDAKQVIGTFLRMFDGSLIKKDGRVRFIMDANYIDEIDEATRSRVFDQIVYVDRFKNSNDFAKYAEIKTFGKPKGETLHAIDPTGWKRVGEYLLESGLSHREIDNVLSRVGDSHEIGLDFVTLDWDAQMKMRNDMYRSISAENIIDRCQQFISRRSEIEEASANKRLEEQAKRMAVDLGTVFQGAVAR